MDTKASAQQAIAAATTYNLIAAVVGALALIGAGIAAFGPLRPLDCSGLRCETNTAAALGLFVGLAIVGCMPAATLMAVAGVLNTLADVLRAVGGAPTPTRKAGATSEPLPSSAEFAGTPPPADRATLIHHGTDMKLVLMAGSEVRAIDNVLSERRAERRLAELGHEVEGRAPSDGETHLAFNGQLHMVVRIYDLSEGA